MDMGWDQWVGGQDKGQEKWDGVLSEWAGSTESRGQRAGFQCRDFW